MTALRELELLLLKQGVECPPGLESKPIIDRLGRHSHRCMRERDEAEREELPEREKNEWPAEFATRMRVEVLERLFGDHIENDEKFVQREQVKLGIIKSRSEEASSAFNDDGGWEFEITSDLAAFVHAAVAHSRGDDFEGEDRVPRVRLRRGLTRLNDERVKDLAVEIQASQAIEQERWRQLIGDRGTLRVYRGIVTRSSEISQLKVGDRTVSRDYAASSWSIFPHVAQSFGSKVMAREVSPEEIVTSFLGHIEGHREGEVIVYTSAEGAEIEVVR